jgi:resolvase-like protein
MSFCLEECLFKSLAEPWADTTTPAGRLILTVLGGLAEFERELIKIRTMDGQSLDPIDLYVRDISAADQCSVSTPAAAAPANARRPDPAEL